MMAKEDKEFVSVGNSNELVVVKVADDGIRAEKVPEVMAANGVQYVDIDSLGWPDGFPYHPEAKVAIAYTDNAILLHYKVREKDVLGLVTEDLGEVWKDACVEFFINPAGDDLYYNIECNCIGNVLLACGQGRAGRIGAARETVSGISRWASLGRHYVGEITEETEWEVALVVPFAVFFRHDIGNLDHRDVKANFYKCGGRGEYEHYLSWNAIDTEKPDFHRPEFFGTLHFS